MTRAVGASVGPAVAQAVRHRTIASSLDPRRNGLNLIRILLALAVILSHSFPVGGFGDDPQWAGFKLGTAAVGAFFGLSGYLITASRERLPLWWFALARFLRIVPGLWVCIAVTAFVIGPIVALSTGGWTQSSAFHYMVRNWMLSDPTNQLGSIFAMNPLSAVNGSLWTLRYEIACYVGVGVVGLAGLRTKLRLVSFPVFIFSSAASVALLQPGHPHGALYDLVLLVPYFLAGALLYLFNDRVPATRAVAAGALVLLVLATATGLGESLAPLPLTYLAIWCGAELRGGWGAIGRVNDLSYGTYIYAFPLQQMFATWHLQRWGVATFAIICASATLPMAGLSWFFVERPAQRLKKWLTLRGGGQER